MSTERAETYLRLLSEARLRRLLPRPAAASRADVVRAVAAERIIARLRAIVPVRPGVAGTYGPGKGAH